LQVGDGFVSDCAHHHPVLRNRKSLRRLGIGRFCEDFRPVSFRSFDLRWRLRSSGRFGLRPKIPFSTAGSSTPDRVRLPGFLGFGRPKATFRTRSAIIADSIQGLRTAGSVLAEHREVARLRCRAAAGLRPRRARGPVRGTRAIWSWLPDARCTFGRNAISADQRTCLVAGSYRCWPVSSRNPMPAPR
jgi:hypothetical protein